MVNHDNDLSDYYNYVREVGKLPTVAHAKRWSAGVLMTLGTTLNRSAKRALANAIPDQLASDLKGVFWLLHFRNPDLTSHDFQNKVARRSGNSDPEFAVYPTLAVFGALKTRIPSNLSKQVGDALPPEIQDLWQDAKPAIDRN